MSQFTRREVINTLLGTTTVAVVADIAPAAAQPVQVESESERTTLSGKLFLEFQSFIRLSAVLTGISESALTPASQGQGASSGADPLLTHKLAYFDLARSDAAVYRCLVREFEAGLPAAGKPPPADFSDLATQLLKSKNDGVRDLARSIIMAWYFGVWYEWSVQPKPRFTVVSADAYTQGWIWRIAQAHPPGNSNLRFGHWAFAPPDSFATQAFKLTVLSTVLST